MLLSQRISLVTVSIRVAAHVVCKRLAFAFSLGIFVVYLLLMKRPDDESVNFSPYLSHALSIIKINSNPRRGSKQCSLNPDVPIKP